MRLLLSFAVLLAAACYNPTPARFRCGESLPLCPDGVECVQGWCGGPPPGGGDSGTPPDGSTPSDIGIAAPGCASGRGFPLGANLYACPGTFTSGALRQLCAPGYNLPFTNVNPAGQSALTMGFFLANVYGSEPGLPPPTAALVCQWTGQPSPRQRYLFGAGLGVAVYDTAVQPCGNFPRAVVCDPGDGTVVDTTDFRCPLSNMPKNQDFDNVINTNPVNGVLCWKP